MSAAPLVKTAIAFNIEVVGGPHKGQSFSIDRKELTIGRGSDNEIILDGDPRISRQHIRLKWENGKVLIENLSEKNPVVIRGKKIKSQVLPFGEKFSFGDSELILSEASQDLDSKKTIVASPTPLRPAAPPLPSVQGPPSPPPYSGPPPMSFKAPRPHRAPPSGSRARFYGILTIVLFALYFFFSSGGSKPKQETLVGPPPSIQQEILQADETKQLLIDQKKRMESLQARRAEENFLKGFRDFRQGQYARAKESFQVVLTLDPSHQEARRYLTLSKLKFDEKVKKSLQQGRVYFENKNYRLCKASFLNVMTMLSQNPSDPSYQEAKKLYDICDLAQGGR